MVQVLSTNPATGTSAIVPTAVGGIALLNNFGSLITICSFLIKRTAQNKLDMSSVPSKNVTQMLLDWRSGNHEALEKLMPLVYDELRRLAGHYMRRERSEHTLQPTALVNEAYIRLVDMKVSWQDRAHFFAVAARLMRRLLVDHARAHHRAKRDSGGQKMSLDDALQVSATPSSKLLALDEALTRLAEFDPRMSEIVELHFFGGLSNDQVAEALAVSRATVQRKLRLAKAWLNHELRNDT